MALRSPTREYFASFDAEKSPLEDIRAFVQNALLESSLTRKEIASLMLAVEESVTNIIRHGYLYGPGKIRLRVRNQRGWIHIVISDNGRAYSIDDKAAGPDAEALASSGRKGGLGLYLIRKVTDQVDYQRKGEENVLTLSKRLRQRLGEPLTKSSWRRRVAWSGVAIVTAVVVLGFLIMNAQVGSRRTTEFFAEWDQFGRTAAAAASQHILNDRSDAEFDQLVVGLKAAHPGVAYLLILSNDEANPGHETVRAHSEAPEDVHEAYAPPAGVAPDVTGRWTIATGGEEVYHFVQAVTVDGTRVGSVVWGVPTQRLAGVIAAERTRLLEWGVVALLAGWILAVLASVWMARPVQRLMEALRHVKERGGETPAVDSAEPEEIRQVMAAFQEATDTVARSERRLAERTIVQREIEASHQLQSALLPAEPPTLDGYEVAAVCRMARHVGGDYYDFIPLDASRWLIIVADVAGKGLPAALTMTAIRTATRLLVRQHQTPRKLLCALHEYLIENHPSGPFVTASCLLLDTAGNGFELSSAGHVPACYYHHDLSSVERLRPGGSPIGVPIDTGKPFGDRLKAQSHTFAAGDLVVLCTDGVVEARSPDGESFGMDHFEQTVGGNSRLELKQLLDEITRDVDKFTGNANTKDDLTLVAIRRSLTVTPSGQPEDAPDEIVHVGAPGGSDSRK